MQNAAPLVQSAHLAPVATQPAQPAESAARQSCPVADSDVEPASGSGGTAAALQVAALPRPETHLASLDLTPARPCPRAIRLAKLHLQSAAARLRFEQTRVRVILQAPPDAAEIEAKVSESLAKAEAAQEIREIVVVSAPATL
jgi:hypothetical protein